MTPTFNLVDEPWIPCVYAGESLPRDVSLRRALADAHGIAEVAHPSPLVTAAIHRLLLAVLHRCFGPGTSEEWEAHWNRGTFDAGTVDRYLDTWAHRFDLFDPERPFYQAPGLPEGSATTIAKLGHDRAAGNNPLLFDHTRDAEPTAVSAAEAARLVLAQQAFALGGLITRMPGDPPSAEATHLVKGAVVLTTGSTLCETLMLNLVQLNGPHGQPFEFDPDADVPAWERDAPVARERREPDGYLDWLTWQPRRVLLFPADGQGVFVDRVCVMDGESMPPDLDETERETMLAYRKRDRPAAGQDPWSPVGFQQEKALWRDITAFLPVQAGENVRPPRTLRWLRELKGDGVLPPERTYGMSAYGLSTDRAKIFLWRQEKLPLPMAYIDDEDLVTALGRALNLAEDVAERLRRSAWQLAATAIAPEGSGDPDRIRAEVTSLAPHRSYWPALDVAFRRFVVQLAEQYASDYGAAAQQDWLADVQRAARQAFDTAAHAFETSGRGFRAAAEARNRFARELGAASSIYRQNIAGTDDGMEETA